MPLKSKYLFLTVLLLGFSFDYLFWKKAPGVSFTIFISLCLAAGLALLIAGRLRPAFTSMLLIPPILFLAVMFFMRLEPMTLFLTFCMTLFLMSILTLTYLGGNWPWYSLPDYIVRGAGLIASLAARVIICSVNLFDANRSRQYDGGNSTTGMSRVWPVLRGLLIALPILAIFTALLASADLVFSQRLGDIADIFSLEKAPEYMLRGLIIIIVAYSLAGAILHAAMKSRDAGHVLGDRPPSPFIGYTEAVIVMAGVVILFASFVSIQFQYFFGGEKNIDLDGYTYAEYARRGFGELLVVAVLSLLLLVLMSLFSRREKRGQRIAFSGLGVVLVTLVLVMLASAFQRIMLYEDAYGFSRLRTYSHVFLVWLGLLLVAVIVLEILQRYRIFTLAAILASLGFVVSLGVLDVDGFIAGRNLQRAQAGEELDVHYLELLSDDAVPALAEAYRSGAFTSQVHDDAGRMLAHFDAARKERGDTEAWQSFNLSRHRADAILIDLGPELRQYERDR